MLKWLAEKWAVNDPLPQKVDLIAVISYAATRTRLTNGSREVMRLAKDLAGRYPEAIVAWGSFSNNPNDREQEIKKEAFLNSVYVGPVSSSTDECEAILSTAFMAGKPSGNVVVVAEGAHSRRCKRVWEYLLPSSRVYFQSIPAWQAADSENPMWFQRYWQVWLLVNIAADLLAYRWRPTLRFLIKQNFRQPAS